MIIEDLKNLVEIKTKMLENTLETYIKVEKVLEKLVSEREKRDKKEKILNKIT